MKLLKKTFAMLLSGAMVFTMMPSNMAYASKADLENSDIKGHWAENVLREGVSDGILKGDASGKINPDNEITRAEFMAIVNRALKLEEKSNKVETYKDVKAGSWYRDEVAKALAAGYITGTSNNMMSPLSTITNEQLYTIIARISKAEGSVSLSGVKDGNSISAWAKDGIIKAVSSGYVTGYQGNIQPRKKATKAQVAVLVDRYRNDNRIIAFPGTYSFKNVKSINVLSDGVVIKDTVVEGNIEVAESVKHVVITGCTVKGKVITKNKNTKVSDKAETPSKLKDGTYEGSAEGYSGKITVRIVIKDGKIADVKVISQTETPAYYALAESVLKKIVEKGSLEGVDAVSGATVTSDAIFKAIREALVKAGAEENKDKEKDKNKIGGSGGSVGGSGNSGSNPSNNDYNGKPLIDGKYSGKADGFRGLIHVMVEVIGGKIADIKITEHREDPGYYALAAETMIKRIIKANGTKVDTVSNATVTSNGIKAAVENALMGKEKQKPESQLAADEADIRKASDKILADMQIGSELKNGEFKGRGRGFNEGAVIVSKINIKNGVIEDVEIDPVNIGGLQEDPGYVEHAKPALKFYKGKDAVSNVAIMMLHYRYVIELDNIKDNDQRYKRAKELLGKKCAEICKGVSGTTSSSDRVKIISKAVKTYLTGEYDKTEMFDAISGATLTSGGMANAVGNAIALSEHDKNTGNKIREIDIVKPEFRKIFANRKDPVKLSELKVKLVNEDKTYKEIGVNDFANDGIVMNDINTGKEITDNMILSDFTANVLNIVVKHKGSLREDNFTIIVDNRYNENWVQGMEYKIGDEDWKAVPNPKMGEVSANAPYNVNNIFPRQTVKLSKEEKEKYSGKKLKLRVVLSAPADPAKPDSKYVLLTEEKTVEVNKEIRFLSDSDVLNKNGNISWFYKITFEAEEDPPIQEEVDLDKVVAIEIKKDPNKMSYKENEKMELDGMVVTLKDSDGHKEDVTAEDFDAYYLTTDPADGQVITYQKYVFTPIKVTFDNGKGNKIEIKSKKRLSVKK